MVVETWQTEHSGNVDHARIGAGAACQSAFKLLRCCLFEAFDPPNHLPFVRGGAYEIVGYRQIVSRQQLLDRLVPVLVEIEENVTDTIYVLFGSSRLPRLSVFMDKYRSYFWLLR